MLVKFKNSSDYKEFCKHFIRARTSDLDLNNPKDKAYYDAVKSKMMHKCGAHCLRRDKKGCKNKFDKFVINFE